MDEAPGRRGSPWAELRPALVRSGSQSFSASCRPTCRRGTGAIRVRSAGRRSGPPVASPARGRGASLGRKRSARRVGSAGAGGRSDQELARVTPWTRWTVTYSNGPQCFENRPLCAICQSFGSLLEFAAAPSEPVRITIAAARGVGTARRLARLANFGVSFVYVTHQRRHR